MKCDHVWEETREGTEITCLACYVVASSPGKKCKLCDLSYHSHCKNCPETIPLSKGLTLKLYRTGGPGPLRKCDICEGRILGKFYHLENGDFDVHPLCCLLDQKPSSTSTSIVVQSRSISTSDGHKGKGNKISHRSDDIEHLVSGLIKGIEIGQAVLEVLSFLFS